MKQRGEMSMVNGKIWLSSPTIHEEEMTYIREAMDSNWVAPLGPNVDAFEREVAAYVGSGYAAATVSGTSAIHLAVKLAGVKPGDIVFCSDLTFSATVNPVTYEGGRQVFIDSERESWNMDPRLLEEAFEKYPQCRCVIVANLYGTPAKLSEIRSICDNHEAILIEDAAESLSATYEGRQTGSFGHYNVLSFNGNKIITTSGGGMLLSDDEQAVRKARFWSTQSREPYPWYEHREIGYNYRMSNISAGIGRGQMLHLNEHKERKKKIYSCYRQGFSDVEAISMNPWPENSDPNFWLSSITINPELSSVEPLKIIQELAKYNIEARPIWKPMHLQPLYRDHDFIASPDNVAEEVFRTGLCLPSDIKNTKEDMEKIMNIVRDKMYGN